MNSEASDNVPSIPLNRNIKLKVDWKALSGKLLEVIGSGFTAAFGGDASSGISALFGALSSVTVDHDPGERAYSLTLLSFGWALDELSARGSADRQSLKKRFPAIMERAKQAAGTNEEAVPITFLDRPTQLPLYIALRDSLVTDRDVFRPNAAESADAIRARFDSAFERGMFEMRVKRPEIWAPIEDIFNAVRGGPVERRTNWDLYRRRLIFDFEVRPTFGQEQSKVPIAQLYTPLRGYWRKENADTAHLKDEVGEETHDVKMLDQVLEEWLTLRDAGQIKLIGGGPGSGKSTTLRAFASRLAAREDWRPLFVPLQHLTLEGDLRDAINRFFTETTGSAFTQAPLSRISIEDGSSIVLIFDGLDEISRPGEAANEIVSLFTSKLNGLLATLNGDPSRRVKAVVSGRMPAFQSAKRHMSIRECDSIEVAGYAPLEDDGTGLWGLDQREDWWQRYSEASGLEEPTPEALKSAALLTITNEPLLCYLLVLSGFATSDWEKAAENHNRIYEALVDSVWERGWGEGPNKRQGPGRELTKGDFNLLMETIALAAWQGGDTRVASEDSFKNSVKLTNAQSAWDSFTSTNGPDVTNLAMNFYLKSAEGTHRGFEFTHKSFGDYLTANALLRIAQTFPRLNRVDFCSSEWLILAGPGVMTAEIHKFMRDETRLLETKLGTDLIKDMKRTFETLALATIREGFVVTSAVQTAHWRASEALQRNAEIGLWSVINSCSLALSEIGDAAAKVIIDWPDKYISVRELINRCSNAIELHNAVILQCMSNIVAIRSLFVGVYLGNADFRGADLRNSVFSGSLIFQVNFEGADLKEAVFYNSMLDASSFEKADLRGSGFMDCGFEQVRLAGAKTDGAHISEGTLVSADLDRLGRNIKKMSFRPAATMRAYDPEAVMEKLEQVRSLIPELVSNAQSRTPRRPRRSLERSPAK